MLIAISSFCLFHTPLLSAAPPPISEAEAIYTAVERWRSAWQQLNIKKYIATYSHNYSPSPDTNHDDWIKERQQRFESQQWVKLKLSGIVIFINDDDRYVANFTQHYQSDSFSEISRKQLLFEEHIDGWLIISETELEN